MGMAALPAASGFRFLQSGVASIRAPVAASANLHEPLYLPRCQGAWLRRCSGFLDLARTEFFMTRTIAITIAMNVPELA